MRKSVATYVAGVLAVACHARPEIGHWEGQNPTVSFTVTGDRSVADFAISVPLGLATCTLKVPTLHSSFVSGNLVFVSPDGAFSIDGKFESATAAKGKVALKNGFYCPDPNNRHNTVIVLANEKDRTVTVNEEDWSANPDSHNDTM
jgi:hypothetical protein